jgi:NAD(P)H-dependent flavin oxidoreductase YrpB (nitropropane dioxygenase family)
MARVAQAELVVAVSNAGGMGCLGSAGFMPDTLRDQIETIRKGTDKPFAANLLLPDALTTEDEQQWAPVRELWDSLDDQERTKLAGIEALLTPEPRPARSGADRAGRGSGGRGADLRHARLVHPGVQGSGHPGLRSGRLGGQGA